MLKRSIIEARELGARGFLFRVSWEIRTRAGVAGRVLHIRHRLFAPRSFRLARERLPFAEPSRVVDAVRERIPAEALARLQRVARDATRGTILCFSRWPATYGDPIDWHVNPTNGRRWPATAYWSRALRGGRGIGDIKLTWEVGRFPHAYHLARAAAFEPDQAPAYGRALLTQIEHFVAANPFGYGVHWNSGQEIAFRLLAWLFGLRTLLLAGETAPDAAALIANELYKGVRHIREHIDYARLAVHNNHLLSEALAVMVGGLLLPGAPESQEWERYGWELLEESADRQFYEDGGYIQQSHTYHRVALQDLLWACAFARAAGRAPSRTWLAAMERSLDFLVPQQNGLDGSLPNYGANDGAMPGIFSTCDYTDFRPVLQSVSLMTRGERLYEPGPWDEEAAWLLGPNALDAPLRKPRRVTVSFPSTGFHVLRGDEESSFGVFRCGSVRDRFSQIDMLHLDVWWRGQNVLVDPGSYLYNGPVEWHNHFFRTASHNTVVLSGQDQMIHHRRFKTLKWTRARLLKFEKGCRYALAEGEHYGYQRLPGKPVHRRSVLLAGEALWVVVDRVAATARHEARLHWLAGDYPHSLIDGGGLSLLTPEGEYGIRIFDEEATHLPTDIVRGGEAPARGWLSRYYGEKVPVPSVAVRRSFDDAITFISVLGPGRPELVRRGDAYLASCESDEVRFQIRDGRLSVVQARS